MVQLTLAYSYIVENHTTGQEEKEVNVPHILTWTDK